MSKKNRVRDAKEGREKGTFVALPNAVIRSPKFGQLSPYAVKLLIDLLAQYRLNNNGDLCATWTLMSKRGWRSKATVAKALKALRGAGFIELTRQGGRNKPNLYAVTFFRIDACNGKLDVQPTRSPTGKWRNDEPMVPLKLKADALQAC